jgi:predicted transglutaminase-like cysteine proteinase
MQTMTKAFLKKTAFALSVFALLFSAPLQARPNTDAVAQLKSLQSQLIQLKERNKNRPPLAYQVFCRKHARECRGGGSSSVRYNKKLIATLYETNRAVNRKIRYRNDRGETWSINTPFGDCEDYALTKRSELIRKGVPASSLRMAVVKTRSGIGHAVLVVRTNRGDLVLDNRRSSIRTRGKTGYKYLKMATANPKKWVSLLLK